MSMLKRNIAPMPSKVWDEIDERAKTVLTNILSARKVVHVEGPMGWDYAVVPEGRLDIIDKNEIDKDTYTFDTLQEAIGQINLSLLVHGVILYADEDMGFDIKLAIHNRIKNL